MYALLMQLEGHQLLSDIQVQRLRMYISKKYAHQDPAITAQVFAHAVHDILERYLLCLDKTLAKEIKKNVLIEVVNRKTFFINGYDVFKGVVTSCKESQNGIQLLKNWLTDYCHQLETATITTDIPWTFTSESALHELETFLENNSLIKIYDFESLFATVESSITDSTAASNSLASSTVNITKHLSSSDAHSALSDETDHNSWFFLKETPLPTRYKKVLFENLTQPIKESIIAMSIWILAMTMALGTGPLSHPLHPQISDTLFKNLVNQTKYIEQPLTVTAPHFAPQIHTPLFVQEPTIHLHLDARNDTLLKTEPLDPIQEVLTHARLQYRHVNTEALVYWLDKRGSLLSKTDYLQIILKSAKDYNLDPILLLAITGQEQNFVQKKHPEAHKMINNPFNVFGSWRNYNTTLEDSTDIAARTLIRLSKNRPDHIDPIQWINRKYAQDSTWWLNVKKLIKQIESHPGVLAP